MDVPQAVRHLFCTLGVAMDLDQLATAIAQTSNGPAAMQLSALLSDWKTDGTNVKELEGTVERFISSLGASPAVEHAKAADLWTQFRDETISRIGGMTMNERLYSFSLFPRWDGATTDEERKTIYAKLLANP